MVPAWRKSVEVMPMPVMQTLFPACTPADGGGSREEVGGGTLAWHGWWVGGGGGDPHLPLISGFGCSPAFTFLPAAHLFSSLLFSPSSHCFLFLSSLTLTCPVRYDLHSILVVLGQFIIIPLLLPPSEGGRWVELGIVCWVGSGVGVGRVGGNG